MIRIGSKQAKEEEDRLWAILRDKGWALDYACGTILTALRRATLFGDYSQVDLAKDLWKRLERAAQDVGSPDRKTAVTYHQIAMLLSVSELRLVRGQVNKLERESKP